MKLDKAKAVGMKTIATATAIAALALGLLTACASPEPREAAETPSVAALAIPEGVVATADLLSLDGVTAGHVEATYDGENILFSFPDFTTGAYAQLLFAFTDAELGTEDCFTDRYQIAFAYAVGQEELHPPTFGPSDFRGDPSFFSTLAVLEYPTGPMVEGECWFKTLAVTPITWALPDLRPELVTADAGAGGGANGEVTLDNSGAPLTYLTKAGDTFPQIAARFGISTDDLLYLNPCRPAAYDPALAYTDELLNLSKERRGARL